MKKRGKPGKSVGKGDKKNISIILIPIRYFILLALMFTLPIIYVIFTALTSYPAFFLLKLVFSNVSLITNSSSLNPIILIQNITSIELIPACIAGSAYLFLLILNLTVQMNPKKRFYTIIISILILLALNIVRIFILSIMYHLGSPFFDFTHMLFWYVLSTIFVIGIWFLMVKMFSIREIPIYSDVRYLLKRIKQGR